MGNEPLLLPLPLRHWSYVSETAARIVFSLQLFPVGSQIKDRGSNEVRPYSALKRQHTLVWQRPQNCGHWLPLTPFLSITTVSGSAASIIASFTAVLCQALWLHHRIASIFALFRALSPSPSLQRLRAASASQCGPVGPLRACTDG